MMWYLTSRGTWTRRRPRDPRMTMSDVEAETLNQELEQYWRWKRVQKLWKPSIIQARQKTREARRG